MKIKCPECSTTYDIKPAILGTEGRSVKCARCGNRWFVSPQDNAAEEDPSPVGDTDRGDMKDWTDDAAEDSSSWSEGEQKADDWDDADTGAPEKPAPRAAERKAAQQKAAPQSEAAAPEAGKQPVDVESFANRPKIKVNPYKFRRDRIGAILTWLARRNYRRISGIALFVGSIGVLALLVLNRAAIVKQAPDLASLYGLVGLDVNLRGLEFRDLRTFSDVNEGERVLVVEGTIRNVLEGPNPVPAVRLTIRGTDLQDIYSWTVEPRTKSLNALDETRFRTILSDPPDGANDIQVRFIDRTQRQIVLE
ncbi:thioredoxin [Roseibium aquae]|uniref:Thioredoxin n=1 Tax=Roseibium aquae TaxID=1323746 RepID=A0A916TDR2_9HYPH|nr:zinc-ribbon domain-containing protein [Roseibium aquae]GGB39745.1 thioredoxin [Roseibium aquae]